MTRRSGGSQSGMERDLVRRTTQPGEEASVWNAIKPHHNPESGWHTDANLYRHEQGGRVTFIDRAHIPASDPKGSS